jgi:hypothetical protein
MRPLRVRSKDEPRSSSSTGGIAASRALFGMPTGRPFRVLCREDADLRPQAGATRRTNACAVSVRRPQVPPMPQAAGRRRPYPSRLHPRLAPRGEQTLAEIIRDTVGPTEGRRIDLRCALLASQRREVGVECERPRCDGCARPPAVGLTHGGARLAPADVSINRGVHRLTLTRVTLDRVQPRRARNVAPCRPQSQSEGALVDCLGRLRPKYVLSGAIWYSRARASIGDGVSGPGQPVRLGT